MPTIQRVYSANTMDFWRQAINQLVANVNLMNEGNFTTQGNLLINYTGSGAALNVANGYIRGNGSLLFSLTSNSIGTNITNFQLTTNTINVVLGNGMTGSLNFLPLSGIVNVSVNPVNSISNSRTDLAAAANAIVWVLQSSNVNISNATLITTGVLSESVGGLGDSTYANGHILIGNSTSGSLDKGNITLANGGFTRLSPAGLSVAMNLVQGPGINISFSGNSGITITANGYANATTIGGYGIIRLVDDYNTNSTVDGVTANAVNALATRFYANPPIVANSNVFGRLLSRTVYFGPPAATRDINNTPDSAFYTVNKPANLLYQIVTIISGGAGGAGCNAMSANTQSLNLGRAILGLPGSSGNYLKVLIPAANIASQMNLVFMAGGSKSAANTGNDGTDGQGVKYRPLGVTTSNVFVRGGYGGIYQRGAFINNTDTYLVTGFDAYSTSSNIGTWNPEVLILESVVKQFPELPFMSLCTTKGAAYGNLVYLPAGGRHRFAPGRPGLDIFGLAAGSFHGGTNFSGGSDAFGWGHGGGGSYTVSVGPGADGGDGAPALIIIDNYSDR